MDLKQRDMLKGKHLCCGVVSLVERPQLKEAMDAIITTRDTRPGWPVGASKGGFSYGLTDDHGYQAVEKKMHIHDWHATILHLLGLDHASVLIAMPGEISV